MSFSLNIIDWYARAPGISEQTQWLTWAQDIACTQRNTCWIDADAPQAKLTTLPMMVARRLKSGARLAVECGMLLLQHHNAGALLFTSRHGELERNFCILQALACDQPVSPTDFALSVHNSAAGNLTIITQQPLVCSALSAGLDTFQQGLYEVLCLLQAGYQRVLMVDFDGTLPDFYHPVLPEDASRWAYAVALVIEAGNSLHCAPAAITAIPPATQHNNLPQALPQSLQFLRHWLKRTPEFQINGERQQWLWNRA